VSIKANVGWRLTVSTMAIGLKDLSVIKLVFIHLSAGTHDSVITARAGCMASYHMVQRREQIFIPV
jgi:hypothetical protein